MGRNQKSIDDSAGVLSAISPLTSLLALRADVSIVSEVDKVFKTAIERYSQIDVVVHCAGILGPIAKLGDADVNDWVEAFVSAC